MVDIKILSLPIDVAACIHWVSSPQSGGINVFIGTVRDSTQGKNVVRLEFEAYESMALKEMHKIADDMIENWPLNNILIHHRTGSLEVGEIPVVIAVSSAHRAAAFAACQFAIDQLKQTVPIWKKEIFEDGEHWVSAHP
jgi:molybdopterin synthase catalytic subunit